MKLKTTLLAACVALLTTSASFGAISVTFAGGSGTPLSITLPAVSWEITNDAAFNASGNFGIGIAVGQPPSNNTAGDAQGGNAADWSASGATTFPGTIDNAFYENTAFGGANDGGMVWFGMLSNQSAANGEIITYSGGTFGNNANVEAAFTSGNYEVYLLSGATGLVATAAGVAVPEPSTYAIIAGICALGFVAIRRRK